MPAGSSITDQDTVRRLVGRHLVGTGIELGPGHLPFPLPFPGVTVSYVDRWTVDEHRSLFPELDPAVQFPTTDIFCNLDVDRLKPVDDASQDFVIASHVLEHVADPIGLLDEIHRVLRPAGLALILLPDRRRTFDRARQPTTLDHLVREFEAKVTEVDDAHIDDFLRNASPIVVAADGAHAHMDTLPVDERAKLFDHHRLRSIHAHCWSEDEFLPVIGFAIEQLGHEWELVDGVLSDDEGPDGFEFGYLLRRLPVDGLSATRRRERFEQTFDTWADARRALHDERRAGATADTPLPRHTLRTVSQGVKRQARKLVSPDRHETA